MNDIHVLDKINTEKSNLFSIGIILLRINLLLNQNEIKHFSKNNQDKINK